MGNLSVFLMSAATILNSLALLLLSKATTRLAEQNIRNFDKIILLELQVDGINRLIKE